MFSSISTAPAKQSVSETISVLSGRLNSALLLEDRRAAILGLRSFAKDFPATVASGAFRSLIGSLGKDGEDVDTVKVVLETLLMLFNPSQDSPEASDEIMLWMADEFTQRQENITLLLEFLDSTDFYSRLYSLQLLAAILSARTDRTEECIFTAPLGISRLVAVLDDSRDAVRSEAISLLTVLTASSADIQKLVAFENAFERIFNIILGDGSISNGGRTVEDCLIFLANLLRINTSNQSLFRESGGVLRLSTLLEGALITHLQEGQDVAHWARAQQNRNIYALLGVVRLLLKEGAVELRHNQAAMWQHGLLNSALQLSFSDAAQKSIRAEALVTCADIIRGNAALQESFAQLQVPAPNSERNSEGPQGMTGNRNGALAKTFVIEGLLDLTLANSSSDMFTLRMAGCRCLTAYLSEHPDIRLHFLRRAIEGYKSGADEATNVLAVLLRPNDEDLVSDPYHTWFASVITFHLLLNHPEAKKLAIAVTEGDAENGEEVVSSIQTVGAHLLSALNRGRDIRVITGYLVLLLGWVFEDLDVVDNFLSEGSNTQSLIQAAMRSGLNDDIVPGLCTMLIGELYEFSTKDSPIPRSKLHSILLSRLGREQYIDKLGKLRSHPLVRDFETTPQGIESVVMDGLPGVVFDPTFVDFFKDNYHRILRAIDREPGMEISVVSNGIQKGISRELVDSLRMQLQEKESALNDAETQLMSLKAQLEEEKAGHRKAREVAKQDLLQARTASERLKGDYEAQAEDARRRFASVQDTMRREAERAKESAIVELENERRKLSSAHESYKVQMEARLKAKDHESGELRQRISLAESQHEQQREQARKAARAELEESAQRNEVEKNDLRAAISRLDGDVVKIRESKEQAIRALKADHSAELSKQEAEFSRKLADLSRHSTESQKEVANLTKKLRSANDEASTATTQLVKAQDESKSIQSELDDLLIVFADVEEKVEKYKARLRQIGQTISDDEDEESGSDESNSDDGGAGEGTKS